MQTNSYLYRYLLQLGDNSLILGHRLSELCGHGPSLETDIALTNISLDLLGEVRMIFQYASEHSEQYKDEDAIAFLREERDYYNVQLVEMPNRDFAHVITRQYLFDQFHYLHLEALRDSIDTTVQAIAEKCIKEAEYHLRFSTEWMKRLSLGTDEGHKKMQNAVEVLYPMAHEWFQTTEADVACEKQGIAPDLSIIRNQYEHSTQHLLDHCELNTNHLSPKPVQGKIGYHTENMGYILAELQYMQRAYPDLQW